jgi:hypothetical protein
MNSEMGDKPHFADDLNILVLEKNFLEIITQKG